MRPVPTFSSPLRQLGLGQRMLVRPSTAIAPSLLQRKFTTSPVRKDDQFRAKSGGLKEVVNRPEITPLFLFTGAIVGLALFFVGKHLVKDKELRLDHNTQQRLKTKTEDLDFDQMAKVADDPDGKLTKEAIDEDKKRKQRLQGIREERDEKANDKV